VLVVDNNADFIALVSRYLSPHRWSVVGARGLAEVRTLVEQVSPQVILLDVLMPGMNGWEILRAIKADRELEGCAVVMLTIVDDRRTALALGAAEHLVKPVDRDVLMRVLDRLCPRGKNDSPATGDTRGAAKPMIANA